MLPYDIDEIRRELYWASFTWLILALGNVHFAIEYHGVSRIVFAVFSAAGVGVAIRTYRLAKTAHH